jgi:hypothetical protein
MDSTPKTSDSIGGRVVRSSWEEASSSSLLPLSTESRGKRCPPNFAKKGPDPVTEMIKNRSKECTVHQQGNLSFVWGC